MASRVCRWWHAYLFDNPLRRLHHKPEEMLAPYVKEGMTVMDVGCGMGFFSIGMAKMVGGDGRVIAVDIQPKMLEVLNRRARRKGLDRRIRLHRCSPDDLGVDEQVDFALAFWVAHEAADKETFADQIARCLKPSATLLVAEPAIHVKRPECDAILSAFRAAGLRERARPKIRLSHAAVFERA